MRALAVIFVVVGAGLVVLSLAMPAISAPTVGIVGLAFLLFAAITILSAILSLLAKGHGGELGAGNGQRR